MGEEVARSCICNRCGEEFMSYGDVPECPYCYSTDVDCDDEEQ
jgi:formylmethanofuran dehydrogenase subunit E